MQGKNQINCNFIPTDLFRGRPLIRDLNINLGLRRDHGLAITNVSLRNTENIKKEICRIFNNNGLRYIKASFDQAALPYQKALDESGYHCTVHYEPAKTSKRKNRQRNNILRYNPPFGKNTTTNIGHTFLAPIDKHFPKDHKLRTIFNRNNIKVSQGCMNNTKQIINNHNKSMLTASIQTDDSSAAADTINNSKTCNCRQKNTYPLDGNCLQSSILYQTIVTRKDNNTKETYIRLTEKDFKTRYRNHTASFCHAKHRNSTELSKHIRTLKDDNIEYLISWRILSSHSPYNSSSKRRNLYLKEKFIMICRPELLTLKKRNQIVSSCHHRNKALRTQQLKC